MYWDSVAAVTDYFREYNLAGKPTRYYSMHKLIHEFIGEVLYTYNDLDQLITERWPDPDKFESVIHYEWYPNGLLARKSEFEGKKLWEDTFYTYTFYP